MTEKLGYTCEKFGLADDKSQLSIREVLHPLPNELPISSTSQKPVQVFCYQFTDIYLTLRKSRVQLEICMWNTQVSEHKRNVSYHKSDRKKNEEFVHLSTLKLVPHEQVFLDNFSTVSLAHV